MNGITHKQAKRHIRADLDGLLNAHQRRDLEAHLDECDACHAESESLASLTARLQGGFHNRWDKQNGPSTNVMANVHSQTRRIMLMNRINTGLRAVGGVAAFLVIIFLFSSVIQKVKVQSAITATQASISEQSSSIATDKFNGEWIAFISGEGGLVGNENWDVYMIHPDGSGLINLTNSPASYHSLQWSPNGDNFIFLKTSGNTEIMGATQNGTYLITDANFDSSNIYRASPSWSPNSKQIAFIDNRNGNDDIYTIYADGRDDPQLKQLTNDPGQDGGFIWSPDGSQIAFQRLDGEKLSIYIMDMDGSNQREVARGSGKVNLRWSLDGTSIYASSTENNWLECEACVAKPAIYQIDLEGQSVRQLYAEQDASKSQGWYLYDTPQNTLYFLRAVSSGDLGFWGTWFNIDGNVINEIGKMVPDQTCKITSGVIVNEHISPNERFSILSNFSACGFDLYLADHETPNPEQKPIHLLRLPWMYTVGQGGDGTYLPIRWSPDGRWLLYDNGEAAIYRLNIEKAMQDPTTEPSILFQSEKQYLTEFTWQPRDYDDSAIEPKPSPQTDDQLLAFTKDTGGNAEIYTMRADGSNQTNLTNYSAHDVNPVWSPDGKRIAFESDRTGFIQIYTMNADGSNLVQITNEEADHAIGTKYGDTPEPWSSDGKKIIFSQTVHGDENCMLYVMDADGSNKIALTSEPGRYIFLGWSPDGQKIVYQAPNFGHNPETRIMIANVDGTSTMDGIVGKDFGVSSQIQWESSDQLVLLGYNFNIEPPVWQLSRMFVTTDTSVYNGFGPTIVASNLPIVALFENTYVAEDQDALRWFAFNGSPIPMSPWKLPTMCEKPVSDPTLTDTYHAVSPDRKHAFVVIFCEDGAQFYLENADGTQIHQLGTPFTGQSEVTEFKWSPDGEHVIVTISTDSSTSLFRFDVQEMLNDPSAKPIQLTTDAAWKYGVVWQPIVSNDFVEEKPIPEKTQTDNRLIAFTAAIENGNLDIYIMHSDGSELTNLTNNPAHDVNPIWSPDGKRIAFESDRTGLMQIFIMNADGSNLTQVTNNQAHHEFSVSDHSLWSPNGSRLLLTEWAPSNEKWMLYVIGVDGQNKTPLGEVPNSYTSPSWSPDGQHVAFILTELQENLLESRERNNIYVVNADGRNLTNITTSLPSDEQISWDYSWSNDAQSILFIADRYIHENGNGKSTLYKASLDGNTLTEIDHVGTHMADWWQGTSFIDARGSSQALMWLRPDGTNTVFNPYEHCEASYTQYGPTYKRGSHGDLIIGTGCPNGDLWFYWANPDGTVIKQLLDAPLFSRDFNISSIAWSSDDKFLAFNIGSSNNLTDMYILNMEATLNDSSVQPLQITLGGGSTMYYGAPSWQPIINTDNVEEKPIPEALSFFLTVNEAESLADFDILEPSYLPAGYTLEGVTYDLSAQKVAMKYTSQESGGSIIIYQERGDFVSDPAVQAYVTPVPIGDVEAEYVQGAWIYDTPETTTPRWDASADFYSLTWQKDEFVFSISFLDGETIPPIQLHELVAIAESLK